VNIIQLFTNLDWFRFHGKQSVINQLQQQGFYDIRISRKMNLEDGCSFIKIAGIYLSTAKGAVHGIIKIYKDRIDSEDNIASTTMQNIIELNQQNFFMHDSKKRKEQYHYKTKKMFYK
jgi:hypothetical protein